MITLPITYHATCLDVTQKGLLTPSLTGATREELLPFGDPTDPIRQIERASIRTFVEKYKHLLTGRVLDFGAGKPGTCRQPQPYRDLVTGEYVAYDKGDDWPEGPFTAILCTQVLQYLPYPDITFMNISELLAPGGWIVITFPTNWALAEDEDLWRFTPSGIKQYMAAMFELSIYECRAIVKVGSFEFPLGFGLVARKP